MATIEVRNVHGVRRGTVEVTANDLAGGLRFVATWSGESAPVQIVAEANWKSLAADPSDMRDLQADPSVMIESRTDQLSDDIAALTERVRQVEVNTESRLDAHDAALAALASTYARLNRFAQKTRKRFENLMDAYNLHIVGLHGPAEAE